MSYGINSEFTLVRPLLSILLIGNLACVLAAVARDAPRIPLDTDEQQKCPDSATVAEHTAILSEMFQPRARNVVNQALRPCPMPLTPRFCVVQV